MENHQCEGRVLSNPRWARYTQCSRKGKVQRDGKWYCGIHDPEKIAARKAKRDAKLHQELQRERQRWNEKYEREAFNARAGNACRAAGITNPEALGDLMLLLPGVLGFVQRKQQPAPMSYDVICGQLERALSALRANKENV